MGIFKIILFFDKFLNTFEAAAPEVLLLRIIFLFSSALIQPCLTFHPRRRRCLPTKRVASRAGYRPILTAGFNSRAQMDLIDFQSNADGSFKFILSYQDHAIEFAHFRALTDKSAASVVAQELLAIFHIQGAPLLLQSDYGREFFSKVIQNLEAMWPGLKIIHGRPRHSQSQGRVERLNRTFNEMLNKWLADNPGKTWKEGVGFLQWQHNTRLQEGFSTVPYKAAYGIALFFGL